MVLWYFVKLILIFSLSLVSIEPTFAKEPPGTRIVGLAGGFLGGLASHELGHVAIGLLRGFKFESVLLNDERSGAFIGVCDANF